MDLQTVENSKQWRRFEADDPFNANRVRGYISIKHGDEYGALFITHVNGRKAPQLIYCTPKLRYPFDQAGRWHFPKAKQIRCYTKYDGTNIYGFSYEDSNGDRFVSYKLRIQPFLHNSTWGNFLDMWNEMDDKYDITKNIKRSSNLEDKFGFSFELFGSRNPILVKYQEPLDTRLLFCRMNGRVLPPSEFLLHPDIPTAFHTGNITRDYVWNYTQSQELVGSHITWNPQIEMFEGGDEGEVWYLLDEQGYWNLFKCLDPRTRVLTDKGWKKLSEIVNSDDQYKIYSFNELLNIYEWKPIIGKYKSKLEGRSTKRVGFIHAEKTANGTPGVNATIDHRFLTSSGWKRVDQLTTNDMILTGEIAPNINHMEIIDGSMLGDGGIYKGRFSFSNTDIEYAQLKSSALEIFNPSTYIINGSKYNSNRKEYLQVRFPARIWSRQQQDRWYKEGIKRIPTDLKISPLLLTIWYLDDGYLQVIGSHYHIILATNGFILEDVKFLSNLLKDYGLQNTITTQNTICFNKKDAAKLLEIVTPFVPSCMNRKILSQSSFDKHRWYTGSPIPCYDFVTLSKSTLPVNEQSVYCIDVADNHNFLTKGGIVHNCKPHEIEAIHWSEAGLTKNVIRATIINSFESWDDPTIENVVSLLEEEFDSRVIGQSESLIRSELKAEKDRLIFRNEVLTEYHRLEEQGLSFLTDKQTVMRHFSKLYPKNEMSKVGSVIINYCAE